MSETNKILLEVGGAVVRLASNEEGDDWDVWIGRDRDSDFGACIGSGLTRDEALKAASRALAEMSQAVGSARSEPS